MKHRIIFATGNEGKMKEVRQILAELNTSVISMKEAGVWLDIVEDGETFAQNALIKARAVWKVTKEVVLADDSGLVVDYLGGGPGIFSARYMGEDTSYDIKNNTIIERMKDAKGDERSARFLCAIAAILPDGTELVTEGSMEGMIAAKPLGSGGFGYDPILFLPEFGKTSAQLDPEEKNRISHRGRALEAMKIKLLEAEVNKCR